MKSKTCDTAHLELDRSQNPDLQTADATGRLQDWPLGTLPKQATLPAEFVNGIGLTLLRVPPGEADPQNVFWLGQTEVTQQQWHEVMSTEPAYFSPSGRGAQKVSGLTADTLPIESISWQEASAFCAKLTEQELRSGRLPAGLVYRLPNSREWQAACRPND